MPGKIISAEEFNKLKQTVNPPKVISKEEMQAMKEGADVGPGQAALESFGNQASFGYAPHLQAMAQPLSDRALNLYFKGVESLTGEKQPQVESAPLSQMVPGSPEYIKQRDINIARQGSMEAANPKASIAGGAAGLIASAPAPGFLLGKAAQAMKGLKVAQKVAEIASKAPLVSKIASGAAQAATVGAAQNPGDVHGEAGLQIPERLEQAKTGAELGAALPAAAAGIGKAVGTGPLAEKMAFKSSGAMLKDYRQALNKDDVNGLGRFMLDNKLIQAGDTYKDVAQKSEGLVQEHGKKISEVYNNVRNKLSEPAFFDSLKPEQQDKIISSGFSPANDTKEILDKVRAKVSDAPDAKQAMAKIRGYLGELSDKYGANVDIKTANDIRGKVDQQINYVKDPLSKQSPSIQKAWYELRTILRNKIDDQVKAVDEVLGGSDAKALKEANDNYSKAITINNISKDRVAREGAKNLMSVTDAAMVGAGGAAGAAHGYQKKGVEGAIEGGLTGAALGYAGKQARKYGTGILATGAESLNKPGALAGPSGLLTREEILRKKQEKK